MILNDGHIPHFILWIQAPCCISDYQKLHTNQSHHSYRHRDSTHLVPLVEMESTAHADDTKPAHRAKHQLTRVTCYSGTRETRNVLINNSLRVLNVIAEARQTRAANDANLG